MERLLLLWQELGALGLCWQEIAEAGGGEDLRHPNLNAEAASTRERLLKLIEDVSPKRRKKLPEPGEGALAGVREQVDQAMRMMGFREPEQ